MTVITQTFNNLSVNTFIRNKIHADASSTGYTTSAFKASAANAHDACIASCVKRGCSLKI
jgi:hypothetical protein